MVKCYPSHHKKLVSLASVLLISLTACGQKQQQSAAPQPIPVNVEKLTTATVENSSEFLGSLEATSRVTLAPRIDGRIIKIAVQEGDRVSSGQLIVQLQQTKEQAEVSAAVSDVNISQADVTSAMAQVKTAEAEVARVQAQVEQSKADLRQQEAEVTLAKKNIERAKFLVTQGAESQQFLDNSTNELDSAIAQKEALQQALNANNKALIAAQANVNAALANVDREKAGLNQAQARVDVAGQNLDFNRVVAPIDGIVGNIVTKIGDYIEAGDQITTITQNQNLELNIEVPIEQARDLKVGLPVIIVNRQGEAQVKGNISFISPRVNREQQSVLAKATFSNNETLQDEQFIRAKIIWSQQPGILIPTTAVSRIAGQNFVFVAEETEKDGQTSLVAKQKAVKLGNIQGQEYQVISGIQPGDKLIVSGIINLADGVPVSSEQLSMN